MPRSARVIVPGLAHHVVQRGNRRQQTFFSAADYARYIDLLALACERTDTAVWAWCLMPNHVHLLLVPSTQRALSEVMGDVHQMYAWVINRRNGWQGSLWQGRYFSEPLDNRSAPGVARYIELNPVRAQLAGTPEAWRWSSASGRLTKRGDRLVHMPEPHPVTSVGDWGAYLAEGMRDDRLGTGT